MDYLRSRHGSKFELADQSAQPDYNPATHSPSLGPACQRRAHPYQTIGVSTMQVLFLNPLEERLMDFPARYLPAPEFEVRFPGSDGALPDDLDAVEAIVYWSHPVGRELLDRLPGLRFIQRVGKFRATGDLSPAFERGILVSATPYGVLARVAQHTLALMLALARNLVTSHQDVVAGTNRISMEPEYARERPVAFNWSKTPDIGSLYDKTLGI